MDVRPFWCDDEGEQAVEDALRATCKRYGVAYIEPGGQHYGNELDHRAIKAALAKKARSARRRALRAAITRAPPPLCVCCSLRLNEAGKNVCELAEEGSLGNAFSFGEGTYGKENDELEAVSDLFVVWGKCGHGMHLTCSNLFDPFGRDPDGGCLRCPECSEPWRGAFIEKISEFEAEIDNLAAVDRAAVAEYLQQHPEHASGCCTEEVCPCVDCMPKEELGERLRRAAEGVAEDTCRCVSRDASCAVCVQRSDGWTWAHLGDEAEWAEWERREDEQLAWQREQVAARNLEIAAKNPAYQAALAWRPQTSLLKRKHGDVDLPPERPPSTDPLHYLPRGWNSSLGRWQSEVDGAGPSRSERREYEAESRARGDAWRQRLQEARSNPYYRYSSENQSTQD